MSKTVIMTVDQVQSVSAALENQVSEMQKVINEVASAHSSLAMDDILSLENYSLKLHWGLLKASSSLKKQSERLEQLRSAAKTAASGIEAEDNGEGKVASSNGGKKSNNWVSWIGAAFPFTVPFTLAPFVAGLFNRNLGNNGSTSSDAYVLTEWNGKETVEKKSDEFHQYYEEIEAAHQQWEAERMRTKLTYTAYTDGVVRGQIRYVSQNSDLGNNGWGGYSSIARGECGFASQSMALSYIGKDVSPGWLCGSGQLTSYGSTYGVSGVKCVAGSSNVSGSEAVTRIKSMLTDFSMDGNKGNVSPVVIHYSGGGQMHAVVVVGQNEDGSYMALDPAKGNAIHNFNISDSGAISGDIQWGNCGCEIDGVQQYMRSD